MDALIFWASAALAIYWTYGWLRHRDISLGHEAQIFCALLLWMVVGYFYFSPNTSKFHMLWAIPLAFFGSSLISAPYVRFRAEQRVQAQVKAIQANEANRDFDER